MKTTRLPNRSAKCLATFRAAQASGDAAAILSTMIPGGEGHLFGGHVISRRKGGAWMYWGRNGLTSETSLDQMLVIVGTIPANEVG
jgi:hypothetical protein